MDIYAINPDTSEGAFLTRVEFGSESDKDQKLFEGTNSFTGQPILVVERRGGYIQLITAYADGKPYIIQWPVNDTTQLVHLAA